jgi:hypothetical protein
MTEIHISPDVHARFLDDFGERVERVGFFLADFDPQQREFYIRAWRTMTARDYDIETDFHVSLKDHVRGDVIKWAWDEGASLIEVHSHGPKYEAEFSPSDFTGFSEWVPHVWWRLQGRPYAAIVTAGDTVDAIAWIDAADQPEQVESLTIDDHVLVMTRRTLQTLRRRK